MRTVALVLFGVAAGLVSSWGTGAAAPVPKHLLKEPEGDKAKLQGTWRVESLKMGGQDLLAALGQNFEMSVEFRGEQFVATANIGGTAQKTTATVKYGTGDSKQLSTSEMQTVGPDGKPVNNGGQKAEAFGYAFDGDKLLLASGTNGGAKAAVDPLKPGPNDVVIVLTRVKEK